MECSRVLASSTRSSACKGRARPQSRSQVLGRKRKNALIQQLSLDGAKPAESASCSSTDFLYDNNNHDHQNNDNNNHDPEETPRKKPRSVSGDGLFCHALQETITPKLGATKKVLPRSTALAELERIQLECIQPPGSPVLPRPRSPQVSRWNSGRIARMHGRRLFRPNGNGGCEGERSNNTAKLGEEDEGDNDSEDDEDDEGNARSRPPAPYNSNSYLFDVHSDEDSSGRASPVDTAALVTSVARPDFLLSEWGGLSDALVSDTLGGRSGVESIPRELRTRLRKVVRSKWGGIMSPREVNVLQAELELAVSARHGEKGVRKLERMLSSGASATTCRAAGVPEAPPALGKLCESPTEVAMLSCFRLIAM